jgi:hypothetical protein
MTSSWVNIALLGLLVLLLLTGLLGLVNGASQGAWILHLHGLGGYGLLALLVWKGRLIVEAFRQGRRSLRSPASLSFLGAAGLLLMVLGTGLAWSYAGPSSIGGFSTINMHGFLALALSILLAWHVLARRVAVRLYPESDRRAILRLGIAGLAGVGAWLLARPIQTVLGLSGADRRFTGSYETGSFTGLFPSTSWLFDRPPSLVPQEWALAVEGAVRRPLTITYQELVGLAVDQATVLIDCTGGWYSVQQWQGIGLGRLLEQAGVAPEAQSCTVQSVTGYARRFPLEEAKHFLLATHVAGKPLTPGHGFPLRLVAPDRRGFEWVKWVVDIRIETSPAWLQPPLPLQ